MKKPQASNRSVHSRRQFLRAASWLGSGIPLLGASRALAAEGGENPEKEKTAEELLAP